MENHNGLKLMMAIRRICNRAAAEGKTTVRPDTLRRIDKYISQMRKTLKTGPSEKAFTASLF
ncbi:MAG: hypothetical protein AUK53_07350 [Betaproteobacteria bacterium CG2_30_59_46]|nr:MAG: hypothetical protein AUK53_07350 [Betaproteobacteria bacterium CG2_30_59_46]PIQ11262.1 MAG: hypothetical protein COW70_12250 [Hydrogenophilales bacterium CG18_big_fil_WC_8_21_14_2_50_58_12]PIY00482.1 MAG: hypothetical protein COZ23_08050 [Hydrogenophilales bacterium CG_4_10_14_3_um_filter_58_23]PJB06496.1 MAG: hypothetical protein CO125_06955 [Hydrogenophilales bacterium CG_4_9_14_3_um_filter_59_35]